MKITKKNQQQIRQNSIPIQRMGARKGKKNGYAKLGEPLSSSSSDSSFTIDGSDSDGSDGSAEEASPVNLDPQMSPGSPVNSTNRFSALLSTLTFSFMKPLLNLGNLNNQLNPEDLIDLMKNDRTEEVRDTFQRNWEESILKGKENENGSSPKSEKKSIFRRLVPSFLIPPAPSHPSLTMSLWSSFSKPFLRAGLLKLIHDLNVFVGPQVLKALINFFKDADAPIMKGLLLCFVVTCSQLTMSICLRQVSGKKYLHQHTFLLFTAFSIEHSSLTTFHLLHL